MLGYSPPPTTHDLSPTRYVPQRMKVSYENESVNVFESGRVLCDPWYLDI